MKFKHFLIQEGKVKDIVTRAQGGDPNAIRTIKQWARQSQPDHYIRVGYDGLYFYYKRENSKHSRNQAINFAKRKAAKLLYPEKPNVIQSSLTDVKSFTNAEDFLMDKKEKGTRATVI